MITIVHVAEHVHGATLSDHSTLIIMCIYMDWSPVSDPHRNFPHRLNIALLQAYRCKLSTIIVTPHAHAQQG